MPAASAILFRGLSPLARGNLVVHAEIVLTVGSIPARAGEPPTLRRPRIAGWVYPRSRGGTLGRLRPVHRHRVYPRSRGGTQYHPAARQVHLGLSPLARGNHFYVYSTLTASGSIPARAGEPKVRKRVDARTWVYPRSRGGTSGPQLAPVPRGGLSPLARGNPLSVRFRRLITGSIPARAGEPRPWPRGWARWRVYPRSRGGTRLARRSALQTLGLSPLARGNHQSHFAPVLPHGSIPARAGEPFASTGTARHPWVYPRSRGGTLTICNAAATARGLSPLARGNLWIIST